SMPGLLAAVRPSPRRTSPAITERAAWLREGASPRSTSSWSRRVLDAMWLKVLATARETNVIQVTEERTFDGYLVIDSDQRNLALREGGDQIDARKTPPISRPRCARGLGCHRTDGRALPPRVRAGGGDRLDHVRGPDPRR